MKASLKLEYSLRVLAQLARRNKGNAVTRIEELARLEDIPPNYLVQLLNELREGGLVDSKRGKTGGYRLARPAEDITLKQVLAVVEPDLVATKITLKGASGPQVATLWREHLFRTLLVTRLLPPVIDDHPNDNDRDDANKNKLKVRDHDMSKL